MNNIATYLFGGPLKSSNNAVLDLIQILDTFRDVNHNVGARALGTEAPDLTSFGGIVVVFLGEVTCTFLHLLAWVYISL